MPTTPDPRFAGPPPGTDGQRRQAARVLFRIMHPLISLVPNQLSERVWEACGLLSPKDTFAGIIHFPSGLRVTARYTPGAWWRFSLPYQGIADDNPHWRTDTAFWDRHSYVIARRELSHARLWTAIKAA